MREQLRLNPNLVDRPISPAPNNYFTMKKENGILIFSHAYYDWSSHSSLINLAKEADRIYNWGDFKEMIIRTHDYADSSKPHEYSFSNINTWENTVPDFIFMHWESVGINDYIEECENISSAGLIPYQINKVGWIGCMSHPYRVVLKEKGSENPELFDIIDSGIWSPNPRRARCDNNIYISLPDLVKKYSILIDVEGNGYSGRLKLLLWSRRPIILVDRPDKEYFYEYLKEWIHYIPVKRDLSDLIEKTQWCLENYSEALRIAENAYEFSNKYLTREACYLQWDKMVTKNLVNKVA